VVLWIFVLPGQRARAHRADLQERFLDSINPLFNLPCPFLAHESSFCIDSIAYICYTINATTANSENRIIKPIGKEADDALESLVDSGVPIEVRMRQTEDLLVDGPLSGGNDHSQRAAGCN
jgi:hypothetical protein